MTKKLEMKAVHIRGTAEWHRWLQIQAHIRGYRTQYGETCIQSVIDDAIEALARRDNLPWPLRRR